MSMKVLIVLPVFNEQAIIKANAIKLNEFLKENFKDFYWKILIVDNNSTDNTGKIIQYLSKNNPEIENLHLQEKGKGLAIRRGWEKYADRFEYFIFMDADLSTELTALWDLFDYLKSGKDLVIGSRCHKDSKVIRPFSRKTVSFGYRLILRLLLNLKINDAPCGFKGINQKVLKEIIPLVKNNLWFFDTEMLYLSYKKSYSIFEIPVNWREDITRQSKVNIFKVSFLYLKEIIRLRFGG